MNCQDYEILIQKAIDGNLTPAGCRILAAHLNSCPECAGLYHEYKDLDKLLASQMANVQVPEDLKANVMSSLPAIGKRKRTLRPRAIVSMAGVAVAAAALVFAAGFSGWFSNGDPLPDDNKLPVADNNEQSPLTQGEEQTIIADGQQGDISAQENNNDITDTPGNEGIVANQGDADSQIGKEEKPINFSGGIMLPKVAHSNESHGSYSLYTLASHADYDAILPRVSGNIVTYYIVADGYNLEWETYLDRSAEPAFLGENESLPYSSSIAGYHDISSEYGYTYIVASSPYGTGKAINKGGSESGFYMADQIGNSEEMLIDPNGGGSLVSWAPDGNKVLYTRADGSLHLYYPDQALTLDIYSGNTAYVCWAADSQNIVFSAYDGSTGHLSIFSVIVP